MESFACYQVFSDWDHQTKGSIFIECIDDVPVKGSRQLEETVDLFKTYLKRLRENFQLWVIDIPNIIFSSLEDNNSLDPFMPASAQAGTWFSPMKWRLEQGDALVIDFQIPEESPYSSICLMNRWGEMIDIDQRQTSLNQNQSIIGGDGRVRTLLSTRDLGIHNWLDGCGYTGGTATWRTTNEEQPKKQTLTVI